MKPSVFEYVAPSSVEETLALLAEYGDEAKVMAGGQSLIPLLNLRMARPSVVVDINGLAGLGGLRRTGGWLHIGALTRQVSLERSPVVAAGWPVLPEAAAWVAHPQIRARGTVGGSAAHADAAAEMPAVLSALDAQFVVRSTGGERRLGGGEFFVGQYESALEPQELLTKIVVPPLGAYAGTGFAEYARRRGDFAIAGAAVVVEADEAGRCVSARIALLGVGPTPTRLTAVEEELSGWDVTAGWDEGLDELIEESARELAVGEDMHADAQYRREIAAHVTGQALNTALGLAIRRLG